MTERPILFSGAMVRAILDGRKTQTRRVAKLPEQRTRRGEWESIELGGDGCFDRFGRRITEVTPGLAHSITGACVGAPFAVGEQLWVRETWGLRKHFDFTDWHRRSLRAVDSLPPEWMLDYRADWNEEHEPNFWRPSIHMPRWASRITLEVTGVRVERLNDISEEDAKAEGVEVHMMPEEWRAVRQQHGRNEAITFDREPSADLIAALRLRDVTHVPARPVRSAVAGFRSLWESINGRGSWDANPWVWVVEFRRVTP